MHRTDTAHIQSLDKFGTVVDFCGNAAESEETVQSRQRVLSELPAETHKLPNIWSAGGRGEPERETLEAERKLSSLEKNALNLGVWWAPT